MLLYFTSDFPSLKNISFMRGSSLFPEGCGPRLIMDPLIEGERYQASSDGGGGGEDKKKRN